MIISNLQYLNWQKKLAENKSFRWFWAFWGIYIVAFFYTGVLFFLFPKTRNMAILALAAFLIARFLISKIIILFYKRQRPYQKYNYSPPTSPLFLTWLNKKFNSMPSGHAASLAAISTVCFLYYPALGLFGFFATFLNGIARIVLGYHYLSDILIGWVIGILTPLFLVFWLLPRLFTS